MGTYIGLVRGINVGGNKIIKMEDLRASFEDLGLKGVKTYVQSGNVVFSCPKISNDKLAKKLEIKILEDFRFSASVIVKTKDDFEKMISRNPFSKKGISQKTLYVTLLSRAPDPTVLKNLKKLKAKNEIFHVDGATIYLCYRNGYGKAKLTNNVFEKVCLTPATTRNWNTVNALYEMSAQYL